MVEPVLLLRPRSRFLFWLLNTKSVRKPTDRSVEVAFSPSAKLYKPPWELAVSAPTPVVPADSVVLFLPKRKSAELPMCQPCGNSALDRALIPLKFSAIVDEGESM